MISAAKNPVIISILTFTIVYVIPLIAAFYLDSFRQLKVNKAFENGNCEIVIIENEIKRPQLINKLK